MTQSGLGALRLGRRTETALACCLALGLAVPTVIAATRGTLRPQDRVGELDSDPRNFLVNPSFESTLAYWSVYGDAQLALTRDRVRVGSWALDVRPRGRSRYGVETEDAVVRPRRGARFAASAWVRSERSATRVVLSVAAPGPRTRAWRFGRGVGRTWRHLVVRFTVPRGARRIDLVIYGARAPTGGFTVDAARVVAVGRRGGLPQRFAG